MRILHCKNTSELAKNLSKDLGLDLIKIDISKFANEETSITIYEDINKQDILITHTLFPETNDKLMQFLLIINFLKNKGAKSVHALIPYLPYSRMDKSTTHKSPTSQSIALLLESAGLDGIITLDLHSEATKNFFKIPVKNITALEIFKQPLLKYKDQDCVIISPDLGGKIRCEQISNFLSKPLVVLQKKRTKSGIEIKGTYDNLQNKHCIVIDDIISTGETLLHTIKFLKKSGAKSINIMVTHNLIRDYNILNEIGSQVNNITLSKPTALRLSSLGALHI
jgi:ribose-phosphate pyrophosphokinase